MMLKKDAKLAVQWKEIRSLRADLVELKALIAQR